MSYFGCVDVDDDKYIEPYLLKANLVVTKSEEKLPKGSNVLTISERISELRYRLKLSKDALGEIAGISGTSINNIENGKTKNPGADVLSAIASKLGISTAWLLLGEGEMLISATDPQKTSLHIAPNDAHAVGFLNDMPSVELPHASFKTWASFIELGGADVGPRENLPTLIYRLPPGRTPADYEGAIVFDIEGDSMEPTMSSGQQVIAWFIPEGKWEHLHNTACVVAYDDTVTVKAILDNDLFINNRLTLRATRQGGGSFTVGRSSINSIWEVREFYGRVPYKLFAA